MDRPDMEALLVPYLADATSLYTCTELPGEPAFGTNLPIVRVTRIGGTDTYRAWQPGYTGEDCRVSLDVWAATKDAANQATAAVRDAWTGLIGTALPDLLCTEPHEETGPAARPDEPNASTRRVGWTAAITVRPT